MAEDLASLVQIIAGPGPAATAASLADPTGEAPRPAGGAVGGPTPLDVASLVVRVAPYAAGPAVLEARVGIAIADPALAQAVSAAVTTAIAAAVSETFAGAAAGEIPTVRVRSRAGLARAGDVAGAIAIVPVTAQNARHLVELVDQLRAAGAAGVQLVWDGLAPPRDRAERHVFAVLEGARATPAGPPVVVSTGAPVVAALHLLIAHRSRTLRKDEPR